MSSSGEMDYLFVSILGFFLVGIGRAIKLYHLSHNVNVFIANVKFPLIGMAIWALAGGLLYKYAGMPEPRDNWITCLILGAATFVGLIWGEKIPPFEHRE
jgi:hypothetical protein